jgi:hypothetical protein
MINRPLHQNAQPLPKPPGPETRDEWEEGLFAKAKYFTVVRRSGIGRYQRLVFNTFREALINAHYEKEGQLHRDLTAMVFAVTGDDHSFCVPPKKWEHYLLKSENRL